MVSKSLIFFITLSIFLMDVHPARILCVVPTASYSHQSFYQQLWRHLALKGHDVVVITTDPTGEQLPNFHEVSIQESYKPSKNLLNQFLSKNIVSIFWNNILIEGTVKIIDDQLNLPQVRGIIQNQTEHFDLLMVEILTPIALGFGHRFKCPMIGLTSFSASSMVHEIMGNPTHLVLYPSQFVGQQNDLTFFQRLVAFILGNIYYQSQQRSTSMVDSVLRKHFGEDTPSSGTLLESVDMLFTNANPLFVAVRPMTPSTINLAGGLHMKPPRPLPKDLQDFLDQATEGVVYFSLGSNIKSKDLTSELRQIIIGAFKEVPYKVLWKFEEDQLPGKPENVKIITWAPQQDVLRHKNVRVFVTQGGIQSLEEALYTHVPLVTIPFFGDQQSNAEKVKDKGLGVVLDRHNLNTQGLKDAIIEVMTSPKYKDNIVKLAGTIQDQPQTALERAIWWTEYVLRHKGGRHLRGPRIPFYQYYYLDISAFLATLTIVLIGVVCIVTKLLVAMMKSLIATNNKPKTS